MPNKNCVFKSCRSDSRMDPTLKFARFPKQSINKKLAEEWVSRVGRDDFDLNSITHYSWVCQKHFPLDTEEFDYRYNGKLVPYREGVALPHYLKKNEEKKIKKFDVLDDHDYSSKVFINKVTNSIRTYQKTKETKTTAKSKPVPVGVPIASPEEIKFKGTAKHFLKM